MYHFLTIDCGFYVVMCQIIEISFGIHVYIVTYLFLQDFYFLGRKERGVFSVYTFLYYLMGGVLKYCVNITQAI